MADEISRAAAGRTDSIHPVRWAAVAVILTAMMIALSVIPVLLLRASEDYTRHTGCKRDLHTWQTIDAFIRHVGKTSPSVIGEYEPILGPKPIC